MRLIDELKRRNVFRVSAAYAVVGWLTVEVADTVFPHLGLPGWTVTLVIALVLLGLPLAVFLAWAFELTPEGVQRADSREPAPAPRTGRRLDRWIAAGLIAVIVVLVAERFWFTGREPAAPVAAPADPVASAGESAAATPASATGSAADVTVRAIAVLPFDNYSPDPADAYFASGIAEEITSQLSRLSGLRVMSRTAVTRALEGSRPLAEIAAELGVGSILEGSVRKAGNRVRINAQLVDPRTGQRLWSQEFDRELDDVFEIQRDVGLAIVGALRTGLTADERQRMAAAPTGNVAAYELYLKAGSLRGNDPQQNREAVALLREAVTLDPKFEKAWSKLAWRYQWETWHGDHAGPAKAMEYSGIALELDPASPDAHAARAAAFIAQERVSETRAAFNRALELDPQLNIALNDGSGAASLQGDLAEGLRLSSLALDTSPNVPNVRFHVGDMLLKLDDDRRLASWLDLAAAEGMQEHRLDILRILLEVGLGRRDAARDLLERGLERWADQPEFRNFAADLQVFLGDLSLARPELERQFRLAPDTEGDWATRRTVRTNYAFLLEQLGERERAVPLYEEALRDAHRRIDSGSESPARRGEIAAILAVRGDADGALEWLIRSFEAGIRSHRFLEQDPMFESLRADRRFRLLLERMAQAKERERARVETEHIAAKVDSMIAAGPRPVAAGAPVAP